MLAYRSRLPCSAHFDVVPRADERDSYMDTLSSASPNTPNFPHPQHPIPLPILSRLSCISYVVRFALPACTSFIGPELPLGL